jgi:hypothetical protein
MGSNFIAVFLLAHLISINPSQFCTTSVVIISMVFAHPLHAFSTLIFYYHCRGQGIGRRVMSTGYCPECDTDIVLVDETQRGARLYCHECAAYLIVIGLYPIELDWVYSEDQIRLGDAEYEP